MAKAAEGAQDSAGPAPQSLPGSDHTSLQWAYESAASHDAFHSRVHRRRGAFCRAAAKTNTQADSDPVGRHSFKTFWQKVTNAFSWRSAREVQQSPAEKRRLYAPKPAINVLNQPAWSNKHNSINTESIQPNDKTHKILKGSI
jgi:hypothetical protein